MIINELAGVLGAHHPTKGMAVTMGVTCYCGFWENRNVLRTSVSDGLDYHRAEVIVEYLTAKAEGRL